MDLPGLKIRTAIMVVIFFIINNFESFRMKRMNIFKLVNNIMNDYFQINYEFLLISNDFGNNNYSDSSINYFLVE